MLTRLTIRCITSAARHARRMSGTAGGALEVVEQHKMFGGHVTRYKHASEATGTPMGFAVYTPEVLGPTQRFPVLYWLSGLTCDDTNFITKAGAQQHLARHGFMVVCPDTSPRGLDLPGEHDSYDFGSAAGFYVNATQDPWKDNYRMFSYVTEELPAIVEENLEAEPSRASIFGHSMGGLGALNCFLKTPGQYQSVSAFAPICNPSETPWGIKALGGYLGPDKAAWEEWDPAKQLTKLVDGGRPIPEILISQGTADNFLEAELKPERLPAHPNITVNMHAGYDHSYYFIASFIEEHINFHARFLA